LQHRELLRWTTWSDAVHWVRCHLTMLLVCCQVEDIKAPVPASMTPITADGLQVPAPAAVTL
jgi:hypothetical protein